MRAKEFVEAIDRMYETKEFDKIINSKYEPIHRLMRKSRFMMAYEKRKAKAFKNMLDEYVKEGRDIKEMHFIPLLMAIDSAEILRDAICFMIERETKDV